MLRGAPLLALLLLAPAALATQGGPHVRGVVRDPDGLPVTPFFVDATFGMEGGVLPVYTDAAGAYDLPLDHAGCWDVGGESPTWPTPGEPHLWLPRAPCVDVPAEGLALDLAPIFRPLVRGVVTAADGTPGAGYSIAFGDWTRSTFGTTTDEAGAYVAWLHFEDMSDPALVPVSVAPPGAHGGTPPSCVAPSPTCVEVPLRGTTWHNVTVDGPPLVDGHLRARHADGTPAPDLSLTLREDPYEPAGTTLRTGEDGEARGKAPPGDFFVSGYKTVGLGYVQFHVCKDAPCARVSANATGVIDFVVPRIHRIAGVVRDAGGPVPSAPLNVWGRDRWSAEARADAAGRYEVAVPEGEYEVWLDSVEGTRPFQDGRCITYRPLCGRADARAGDARVDLDVPALGTLVARAVDADGEPIERVDVSISSGRFLATAKSDAEGLVRLRAPVGTYDLWTRPPLGYEDHVAPVRCDACVTLAAGATVERAIEHPPGALLQGSFRRLPFAGGDEAIVAAFLPDAGGPPIVAASILTSFDLVLPPENGTVVVVGPEGENGTWGAWATVGLKPGERKGMKVNLTPLDVTARATVSGVRALHVRGPNESVAVLWSDRTLGEAVVRQDGAVLPLATDLPVLGPTVAIARVRDAPWDATAWAWGAASVSMVPEGTQAPVDAPPDDPPPDAPSPTAAREAPGAAAALAVVAAALAAFLRKR